MGSFCHFDNMTLLYTFQPSLIRFDIIILSPMITLYSKAPLIMSKSRQFRSSLDPVEGTNTLYATTCVAVSGGLTVVLILVVAQFSCLPESFQRSSEFSNRLRWILARYHCPTCSGHATAVRREAGFSCLGSLPLVVMRTSLDEKV